VERVAFLVQSLRLSGGHQVVVEHSRQLAERHGFDVTLVVTHHQAEAPWQFEGLSGLQTVDLDDVSDVGFDLVIATWWDTVRFLGRVPAKRHAYFVQSLEDRFSEDEPSERFMAGSTYCLGLPVITEARWIARVLQQMGPDVRCHLVRNGVNKSVFPVAEAPPDRQGGPLRVLVEGSSAWLKGMPEAMEALRNCAEQMSVTVVGGPPDLQLPSGARRLEPVPQTVLADLFADHDVMLKTSRVEGMYGPPLEAFHRGMTVVTTPVTGHEEYVQHGWNGLVTDWDDPVGAARLLDLLARDRRLLHFLRTNALATARAWPDWEQAGDLMAAALRSILSDNTASDAARGLPLMREGRSFAESATHRAHEQKVKIASQAEHIAKLERAWHEAAAQAAESALEIQRRDSEIRRLAQQVAELNARIDRRVLRFARRMARRLRG
jgi:glycosyltransferase involved in cell wall biosynthesis